MYVGVAYYPEHWDHKRWATDARLMRDAGFNLVRMAEFAWVKMEPSEGKFDFAWLDEALSILADHGISAILGTPTESMPAWVARKYPEVVAMDKLGNRLPYGARRDNCPTSGSYRLLSQRITEAMATQYANNPAVIGWQIDNEFSGPFCYCPTCESAWHAFLAEQYGTIDELNRCWGTIFWGHTYRSFEEVSLPRRQGGNPSLELAHRRFHSRQIVSFQREQVDVLRRITPDKFITHNLCGFFLDEINYYDLAADLDFASLDYYYNNSPWGNRFHVALYEAAAMELMRSVKKKNFWVTETPAGPIGSEYFLRNLRPLEMRRMNYQALAHGADGLMWFRWRTCRYGVEQYTHGLLGHDGIPGRRYAEASRVANEFQSLAPALEGTTVRPQVAIVYTYENRWAFGIQPNARDFDYFNHLFQYHRSLKKEGVNIDFVNDSEDIAGYRAVILPAGYIVTPEFAKKLEDYVRAGGKLLLTTRSGVKDTDNVPYESTLPGFFRQMAGIKLEEYEALLEEYPVQFAESWGGGTFGVKTLADWVIPETAQVVAGYQEPYLRDFAAVTVNDFGAGKVYYIGTCFSSDDAVRLILTHLLDDAGVKRLIIVPDGVITSLREKGNDRFLFILNHNDDPVEIDLSALPPCREMVSQQTVGNILQVAGGDVAVLHWQEDLK